MTTTMAPDPHGPARPAPPTTAKVRGAHRRAESTHPPALGPAHERRRAQPDPTRLRPPASTRSTP